MNVDIMEKFLCVIGTLVAIGWVLYAASALVVAFKPTKKVRVNSVGNCWRFQVESASMKEIEDMMRSMERAAADEAKDGAE